MNFKICIKLLCPFFQMLQHENYQLAFNMCLISPHRKIYIQGKIGKIHILSVDICIHLCNLKSHYSTEYHSRNFPYAPSVSFCPCLLGETTVLIFSTVYYFLVIELPVIGIMQYGPWLLLFTIIFWDLSMCFLKQWITYLLLNNIPLEECSAVCLSILL